MSVDVRLYRPSRVYLPNEIVKGVIVVESPKGGLSHQGLCLDARGEVNLQLSSKSLGLLDSVSAPLGPRPVLGVHIDVQLPGKFPEGTTELQFEFNVKPLHDEKLLETYHGVCVSIQYVVSAEMTRRLAKNLRKDVEFYVHLPKKVSPVVSPKPFSSTGEKLQALRRSGTVIPDFSVTGQIDSLVCCVDDPLTGQIVVDRSSVPLRSIELQLVRVESISVAGQTFREASEIQNIQVGEGDVMRGWDFEMLFPRLFTCPTCTGPGFQIEFEVNLVLLFAGNLQVTDNFGLTLYRTQ